MSAERTQSTANALDDGLPSLYEELNRKTLETAIDLITDYTNKTISGAQFYTGYQTLFKTVNGLASTEVTGYAFEGSGMVAKNSDESFASKRVFVKGNVGIAIIKQIYGAEELLYHHYDAHGTLMKTVNINAAKLDALVSKITWLGYKEVL